jgi:translation initiation factor IF-2
MGKIRVYELAKEMGIGSKELLDILKDLGVEAKSHASSIEDSTAKLVQEVLNSQGKSSGGAQAPVEEKVEAPPAAPVEAKPAAAQDIRVEAREKTGAPAVTAQPAATAAPPAEKTSADIAAVTEEKKPGGILITLPITLSELARKVARNAQEIIKKMLVKGMAVTINQSLGRDEVARISEVFGFQPDFQESMQEDILSEPEDDPRLMVIRPPVVTILGHVDHGKTSLLDVIRKTNVTAGEAGGITQRIGAYTVDHGNRKIVFLDTPGHEAFTAMRARGAQITDIAILVVAADDGVMPQTIEAINHAKAAGVPVIVTLNKIDKPQANPDRVKQQLSDLGLIPEDWGGDTITIPVSAKAKTGLDDLLEMILLVADMQEFKANPRRKAQGIIIEAKMDKGLGPVATVLVQKGTLRVGDAVIAGTACGRIRLLINDKGDRIKKAAPSIPAEIIGLSEVPRAGDQLVVVSDEKLARQICMDRQIKSRSEKLASTGGPKTSLEDLFKQLQGQEKKELNLIVKADGQGSVEALRHSLSRITNEEVKVNIIHSGVGPVSESDILLANASNAVIIGFNIRQDPYIKKLAESEKIDVRNYNVIYNVIDDINAAITGMLSPVFEEVLIGRLEVRNIFKISKYGTIAGGYVMNGKITRSADVRVVRNNEVIHQGKIESLKRFKDDVREVLEGFECGVGIEKFPGIQVGDIVEVYQTQEKQR